MQKQQVFKVKGMQRDASMANANGEFAYEILNMRLMPAEDLSGFSLTNEKGTTEVITGIKGQVIGQCPTNDSLVVFTTSATYNENDVRTGGLDYIYEIYQTPEGYWDGGSSPLYEGDLNFHVDKHIEALFNYETEDIQKVYWIDGINQLRCINLVGEIQEGNDQQFDSVKEINSLPSVEIERVIGGSFTAGVIQYYVTYFNKNSSESPIVYTSPLLYIAHDNRGANVNDQVSTAFKLTFADLDTDNWESIRIYATHRTSIDATPEASIITESKMNNSTIEFTDYGSNRTSIAPTDLYFTGGKFVKAGTMTVKDQVMFLGHLDIQAPDTIAYIEIKELFDKLRESGDINNFFSTKTRKQRENKLSEYEDTYYHYKNQLNNTEYITHYKYGEKYRFGISVMDKYGVWSNPIWIKDEFILVSPEQINSETLELPCPTLNLSVLLDDGNTLWEKLHSYGAVSIKPLVVFPSEEERKIIAQGVVCPTVYNLKDRKENGPYAQASWFMRPNVPADLWGFSADYLGSGKQIIVEAQDKTSLLSKTLSHKSDLFNFSEDSLDSSLGEEYAGYYNVGNNTTKHSNGLTAFDYLHDDFSASTSSSVNNADELRGGEVIHTFSPEGQNNLPITLDATSTSYTHNSIRNHVEKGAWLEFRHGYALRSAGWSYGAITPRKLWSQPIFESTDWGMSRISEFDISTFNNTMPVNRVQGGETVVEEAITTTTTPENVSFYTTLPYKNAVNAALSGSTKFYVYAIHRDSKITIATFEPNYGYSVDYGNGFCMLASLEDGTKVEIELMRPSPYDYPPLEINNINYYKWDLIKSQINYYFDKIGLKKELTYISNINTPLLYGTRTLDHLNTGSSSYYIDNSIITVNSPEIELSEKLHNLNTNYLDFRIIGMIPLTATASDMSVIAEKPAPNPQNWSVGLSKAHLKNTNIGYHGFKGIVSANAYFSYFNTVNGTHDLYGLVPLSPWHSEGTLTYSSGNKDNIVYSTLSKKILSNLRYSASSHYFKRGSVVLADNLDDTCYLDNQSIGWKPANGCSIAAVTSSDGNIYKLTGLNYLINNDIIYKGSITDGIATTTSGENSSGVISTRIFSLGQNYNTTPQHLKTERLYDSATSKNIFKQGIGASIKYKSSPHFVVGFIPFNDILNTSKIVQETLPTIRGLNEEGLLTNIPEEYINRLEHRSQFGNLQLSSLYHQNYITIYNFNNFAGLNTDSQYDNSITSYYNPKTTELINIPNYGWLWLGEIYRETDPTFGGTSDYALQNNQWENGGPAKSTFVYKITELFTEEEMGTVEMDASMLSLLLGKSIDKAYLNALYISDSIFQIVIVVYFSSDSNDDSIDELMPNMISIVGEVQDFPTFTLSDLEDSQSILVKYKIPEINDVELNGKIQVRKSGNNIWVTKLPIGFSTKQEVQVSYRQESTLEWTQGDTYYQRFDTLKTYAHDDAAHNSIVDITSFMVETRINIDGRTDRNRGQESNLTMSPTNFNLINDVYSQKDNFFTYRILDEDLQARTNFPNQITWSLTKTAGATVDAWMNITLASVLDLDGTKGKISALKNFNNNIIAFQEKGLSHIMFNSRAQIATSEAVPIQIANTGKVDGQQYFTTDVGCQDKWNIVTTPNGLYFVDYFNKSIYKFNGQLEDISTPNGFRSWCYENLNSTANILGYYDIKNKEVMYYIGDTRFKLDNDLKPTWLGFSELTGAFSSFYTYPKAWFANVQDQGLWLSSGDDTKVYTHQTGNYNELLTTDKSFYGLTVIPRQDSNTVKTFNNTEFRADSFDTNGYNESILPFDTTSAETEYQPRTTDTLTYSQYRPSNLKKKFRTWRANIPRVNNGYNRFVNQWAKIGLWKMNPSTEKTILHDLSVWYSE